MRYLAAVLLVAVSCFLHGMEDGLQSKDMELMHAVQLGHLEFVKDWLDAGGDIRTVHSGNSLLGWALMINDPKSRIAMFEYLLEKGASQSGPYLGGSLVGEIAAMDCANELKLLLERGVHINQTFGGKTALMYAAGFRALQPPGKCSKRTLKLLLKRGANANVLDGDGKWAVDYVDEEDREYFKNCCDVNPKVFEPDAKNREDENVS